MTPPPATCYTDLWTTAPEQSITSWADLERAVLPSRIVSLRHVGQTVSGVPLYAVIGVRVLPNTVDLLTVLGYTDGVPTGQATTTVTRQMIQRLRVITTPTKQDAGATIDPVLNDTATSIVVREQCCERDHNHDGNCDRHPPHHMTLPAPAVTQRYCATCGEPLYATTEGALCGVCKNT